MIQSSIQSSVGILFGFFSSSILARLPSHLVFPRSTHPFRLCLGDLPRLLPSSRSSRLYSPPFYRPCPSGYRNDVRCMPPFRSESSVLLIIGCPKCILPRKRKESGLGRIGLLPFFPDFTKTLVKLSSGF